MEFYHAMFDFENEMRKIYSSFTRALKKHAVTLLSIEKNVRF